MLKVGMPTAKLVQGGHQGAKFFRAIVSNPWLERGRIVR